MFLLLTVKNYFEGNLFGENGLFIILNAQNKMLTEGKIIFYF